MARAYVPSYEMSEDCFLSVKADDMLMVTLHVWIKGTRETFDFPEFELREVQIFL